MQIKYLAQGENILMLGFEPSTFCIQNRHSNHYTNWKILNNIMCKGISNVSDIPDTFIKSNKKYYEPKATDNSLKNYFAVVGFSISSKISYLNGSINDYLNKKCEKNLFLMSVAESEIVYVVNELS